MKNLDAILIAAGFKNVTRQGKWVNFSCPLATFEAAHKYKPDRSPSAGATQSDKGLYTWNCFCCKGSGSLISLFKTLSQKTGRDFSNTISKIDNDLLIPDFDCEVIPENYVPEDLTNVIRFFEEIEDYPIALQYLQSRDISLDTAKKLRLKYNPDNSRIIFPIFSNGKCVGFSGRTVIDETPKIKNYSGPWKSQHIMGADEWQKRPVIIVEGLFAYARLIQHDLPYNVGALLGSSPSFEQLDFLLQFGQPCYWMLDNDPAGKLGVFGTPGKPDKPSAKYLSGEIPNFTVKWPENKTDPDELTREQVMAMIKKPLII